MPTIEVTAEVKALRRKGEPLRGRNGMTRHPMTLSFESLTVSDIPRR